MSILNPQKTMMTAINHYQPDWSGHDRQNTMGASESATCARKFVYAKEGVPEDASYVPDPGAFERGHAIEDWWVGRQVQGLALERKAGDHDIELLFTGTDQKTLVRGAQSATPDGLYYSEAGNIVLTDPKTKMLVGMREVYCEIKSKDPRPYERLTEPEFAHVQQCIQGMDLMRKLTEYQPDYALLTYINCSFVSQQMTFVIPFDQDRADALRARGDYLMYEGDLNNLPDPEGRMYGGQYCEYCPWADRCLAHDAGIPLTALTVGEEAAAEIAELARKRHAASRRVIHHENVFKSLGGQLEVALTKAQVPGLKGDWGSVAMRSIKGRSTTDNEALQEALVAAGLSLSQFSKTGEPYKTITVRMKKGAD